MAYISIGASPLLTLALGIKLLHRNFSCDLPTVPFLFQLLTAPVPSSLDSRDRKATPEGEERTSVFLSGNTSSFHPLPASKIHPFDGHKPRNFTTKPSSWYSCSFKAAQLPYCTLHRETAERRALCQFPGAKVYGLNSYTTTAADQNIPSRQKRLNQPEPGV